MTACNAASQIERGLDHRLFIYHGRDEYLRGIGGFVKAGLEAGEPVIAVLPPQNLELLRDHLGSRAASVEMVDMCEVGRNPARLIPSFAARVRSSSERRLRLLGEPMWPGRSREEIDEVMVHEALCNVVLGDAAITGLCPYDAERLDPSVIAAARATHPRVAQSSPPAPNPDYLGERWPRVLRPLDEPPGPALTLRFGPSELRTLRSVVQARAEQIGLERRRRCDLVLAVNEVASNALQHGGGSGWLRMWSSPDRITVEVHDTGGTDPCAASRRARASAASTGGGLWLANQLCELVQIRTGADGTTVRLRIDLSGAHLPARPDERKPRAQL